MSKARSGLIFIITILRSASKKINKQHDLKEHTSYPRQGTRSITITYHTPPKKADLTGLYERFLFMSQRPYLNLFIRRLMVLYSDTFPYFSALLFAGVTFK